MNRHIAEQKLKKIFGFDHFYDEQWQTIEKLLKGERILLIERTGYGKSLCFQFPATQFSGLTVIFSPLIALMRDEVNNLNKIGVAARYINSEQTPEENAQTMQEAIEGRIKILYIAPERQENKDWIEATRKMNLSMVVIDEAHTISVWGHDFRPAFRRIVNLVQLLPKHLPVLAATATATKRVQKDIEKQIAGKLTTIRGNLMRENFYLSVIETNSEEEKLLWLAENLNQMEGNGLIYSGTRVKTEIYSRWFDFIGIPSVEYNAGLDGETRKSIETGFMENKWKCVVSTNALGMGIDKSDISFIIHTQIPASPIHYYQEIGRAGRNGKPAHIILFFNSNKNRKQSKEDCKLPKAFLNGSKPKLNKYKKVIKILKEEPLGERQIMREANLKQTEIRVIKADLIDQGIVREVIYGKAKKYEYQFGAPELNHQIFKDLRKDKKKDLKAMVNYVYTKEPRMKFLCEYLGDTLYGEFKNCDNTTLPKQKVNAKKETIDLLTQFTENYFPVLEVETKCSSLKNGIASSYYGASNVGTIIHRCKYENGGDFPLYLLKLALKAFWRTYGNKHFDLVVYVPSTNSGDLVKNFSEKIASALKIPISHNLVKTRSTQPQKIFQNGYLKRENVLQAFRYNVPEEITGKNVLLVDDICDSGATIREIGKVLTKFEAESVVPLVIAKTVGGDI